MKRRIDRLWLLERLPYTKNLVKAMQAPNKPIEQVFKEVRRAVQDETKNQQTPWENTSLSGDFFFKVQR